MIERGLKAHELFERVILPWINERGIDVVLKCKRLVQLYSGPEERRSNRILTNWVRAARQATKSNASLIDDTETFDFLNALKLREYFSEVYLTDKEIKNAVTEVWGYVSELFVQGKFEEVATAVCGASPERVFRKFEQEALLKNPNLKIINGHDVGLFRAFQTIDPEEAFQLFCITELTELRHAAQRKGTKKAWHEYHMRRKFFLDQRRATRERRGSLSAERKAETKLRKRQALTEFSLRKSVLDIEGTDSSVPVRGARKFGLGKVKSGKLVCG